MSSPLRASPESRIARYFDGKKKVEVVCVCCQNGEHGSHLIGGARCECPCHASNRKEGSDTEGSYAFASLVESALECGPLKEIEVK